MACSHCSTAVLHRNCYTYCLQVSVALQRDLLKGLADAAREQSRSTVTAVVNSVTPVVAQAVAGSLQRELAGSAAGGVGWISCGQAVLGAAQQLAKHVGALCVLEESLLLVTALAVGCGSCTWDTCLFQQCMYVVHGLIAGLCIAASSSSGGGGQLAAVLEHSTLSNCWCALLNTLNLLGLQVVASWQLCLSAAWLAAWLSRCMRPCGKTLLPPSSLRSSGQHRCAQWLCALICGSCWARGLVCCLESAAAALPKRSVRCACACLVPCPVWHTERATLPD
jgi:hypothetical protein